MIDYSSGQRLQEIRVRRITRRLLIVRVVLTQHTLEDLRSGCVSVRWPVRAGTEVRDRGRATRVPSAARNPKIARALRRDCRRVRVVRANARVDAGIGSRHDPPPAER